MNAVGEETPGYFYDTLFVIGMVRHVVSKGLDVLRCVGHGDACPGVTQHADIVVTVAAADDVCRGNAQEMEELLQAKGFIDAARRHFQAQRLGMIDFGPSQIELGQEGIERVAILNLGIPSTIPGTDADFLNFLILQSVK